MLREYVTDLEGNVHDVTRASEWSYIPWEVCVDCGEFIADDLARCADCEEAFWLRP
jgi:hypothetical protein